MRATSGREYLGAYATGILTSAEERWLHKAALDDQELFNALAHEELFREALEDHIFRHRLKQRLSELGEPTAIGRVAVLVKSLWRPPALAAAGMAAIVVTAILLRVPDTPTPEHTPLKSDTSDSPNVGRAPLATGKGLFSGMDAATTDSRPSEPLELLWARARTGQYDELNLSLDRGGDMPQYRVGEQVIVRLSAPTDLLVDASVVLLAKDPYGAIMQLLPSSGHSLLQWNQSDLACVLVADRGYSLVAGTEGVYQLRLLVFQGTTGGHDPELAEHRPPIAVVERRYEVVDQ